MSAGRTCFVRLVFGVARSTWCDPIILDFRSGTTMALSRKILLGGRICVQDRTYVLETALDGCVAGSSEVLLVSLALLEPCSTLAGERHHA